MLLGYYSQGANFLAICWHLKCQIYGTVILTMYSSKIECGRLQSSLPR